MGISSQHLMGRVIISQVFFTAFQRDAYIETVESALDVYRKTQMFNWLQNSFQALLPHEIAICGVRIADSHQFHFEHFSSTRYFGEEHLHMITADDGILTKAMQAWQKVQKPVFLSGDLTKIEALNYSVPFEISAEELQAVELKNMVMLGIAGQGGVSGFYCFSRVSKPFDLELAHALQMLVPHVHIAYNRVLDIPIKPIMTIAKPVVTNTITERETEILQWVNDGKTNQEISEYVGISSLTVKNHIQSILRKLGVKTRGHAAVKGVQLGLIKASTIGPKNAIAKKKLQRLLSQKTETQHQQTHTKVKRKIVLPVHALHDATITGMPDRSAVIGTMLTKQNADVQEIEAMLNPVRDISEMAIQTDIRVIREKAKQEKSAQKASIQQGLSDKENPQ